MSRHATNISGPASVRDNPRILIAEGPWGIQEGQLHDGFLGASTLGQGYDKVTHKCPWKTNWFQKTYTLSDWMMKNEAPFCPHCSALVPSMIQTLWTLKNMDHIQADANYGAKQWPTAPFYAGTWFYLHGTTNYTSNKVITI